MYEVLRYSPAIRNTARSAGSSWRMLRGLSFAHSLRLPSSSNSMIFAAQAVRLLLLHHARVPRRMRLFGVSYGALYDGNVLTRRYHHSTASTTTRGSRFLDIVYITAATRHRDTATWEHVRSDARASTVKNKSITLTLLSPSCPSLLLSSSRARVDHVCFIRNASRRVCHCCEIWDTEGLFPLLARFWYSESSESSLSLDSLASEYMYLSTVLAKNIGRLYFFFIYLEFFYLYCYLLVIGIIDLKQGFPRYSFNFLE